MTLRALLYAAVALLLATMLPAQQTPPPDDQHNNTVGAAFTRHLLHDQKAIWTSPLKAHAGDLFWIAPLGAVTGGLIATDAGNMRHISSSPHRLTVSRDISNAGAGAMIGSAGAFYLVGHLTQNAHARETGLLAGEALANSLVVASALKVATRRDRPSQPGSTGQFWSDGFSFPSEHSTVAWSVASVVAHEYPGPLTSVLAYGTASAVAVSRVTGRKHFPSDVLVGSTLGYLIGRYVYRAHHDPQLGGAEWGTFSRAHDEPALTPAGMGSPYVPLDSWIYPLFDRLSALGHVQTAFAGLRPWTRMECARVLQERAEELANGDDGPSDDASAAVATLRREFAPELERLAGGRNRSAEIESIYSRFTNISGAPLTDGYHFAQTLGNDFGRPYGRGANVITGIAGRAEYGPLAFYVRGEYQRAPGVPEVGDQVRQAIAAADHTPIPSGRGQDGVSRVSLLDTYVALAFRGWQASFGKQSLWWGPGAGGALMFSDNAEPVTMFRLSRTAPTKLPSVFGWLGPVRTEFFFGQLSGHRFITPDFRHVVAGGFSPQPYIHGEKLTFKPTPNLEFGFSRTALLGGPGLPLTWRTLARSYFATTNVTGPNDPGDRRAGFDFSYRIPGLRNWLVLYNDALAEDEISPLGYPRHSAMNPGLYMPQLPGMRKLDLRVEAAYTDVPGFGYTGGWFYWNDKYLSGYTNQGQLLGHWVGRQGRGLQGSSTYWFSAQNKISLAYRHAETSREFLGGGALDDISTRLEISLRPEWRLSSGVQYERWKFPLLSPAKTANVSAWIQLTYSPVGKSH